jgi:amino acid adenylation domain-containing protein
VQDVCELTENLDVALLKSAWRQVALCHTALRTGIHAATESVFKRCVHQKPEFSWLELDWSGVAPGERQERLTAFLRQDWERGFNFDGSVPMRFTLLRISESFHILIWTVHHVLLDGRSLLIVWRKWLGIYDALRRGEEPHFEDEPAWIQPQDPPGAEHYWRKQFAGVQQTTGFVIEHIRPMSLAHAEGFAKERGQLSSDLTSELWEFAREHDITVNNLVQGAWALLLARYSGRSDVVFGAIREGRRSSIENEQAMVGVLINTLPIRITVPSDALLLSWLKEIRKQWITLRDYEHTPLDKIVKWSGLPPGTPPFDNVLAYQHEPVSETLAKLGGEWERRKITRMQRTDAPLTLVAYGRPLLTFEIVYDQRLLGKETATGMVQQLCTLLKSFVTQCQSFLAELKMLTEREEKWLLKELNQSTLSGPDLCAHRLFEEQAARTPGNTALDHPGGRISYEEVNRRANRLARFLRHKGAGPEDFVAVCLDRSPEAVIAVLAVLKAGAAFLPLDSRLPQERLVGMIDNAGAKLVLSDDTHAEKLAPVGYEVLNLTQLQNEVAIHSADDLADGATPANAAYAIYTSGSSGAPKAVVVTHRALVNHTRAVSRTYEISENDRRLQFASMGTDVFIAEVFNYLSNGATLVFGLAKQGTSVAEFLRLLDVQRITITGIPSTWWNEWVGTMSKGNAALPRSLRAVIAGMERVNPAAYATWKRVAGSSVRWFNAYGPTETSPTTTIYEAGSSEWEDGSFVPIGKPIANMRAYVLDNHGNPVPAGIPGELFLGGAGLARGYLNAPELTAARFVKDPFSENPESRLYRTGDQVVYLPDGNLVFLGSWERQEKSRGFRVELEEIEVVLATHPDVRQCAVQVRGTGGQENLVAYVTPVRERALAPDQLRRYLAAHLPNHMLPAGLVILNEMPLTSSGEIDLQALPDYEPERLGLREEFQEPSTVTEKHLAAIWRQVLGIRQVGVTDNFFELGGDSLRAAQLLVLIHDEFRIELALTTLLQAPTIARIAALVDGDEWTAWDTETDTVVTLESRGKLLPLFCIASTLDGPYCFRHLARHLGASQPFFVLRQMATESERTPTVEELASRALHSLRRIRPSGPYILAGYCFGGIVAFETARQLRSLGEEVRLVALFDTPAPGYPKLLRSRGRYWRQLREIVPGNGNRTNLRSMMVHFDMVGRLIKRKVVAQVERRLAQFEPKALVSSVGDIAKLQERSTRMYVPKSLEAPVVQFIARDETISARILEDPRLGWRDLCRGEFQVHDVCGSHGTLFGEPQVKELAGILGGLLQRANRRVLSASAGR